MASARVLCAPFAGGGVGAFRGWGQRLGSEVEAYAIQLPGREDRFKEVPCNSWAALFSQLTQAVAAWPRIPVALFGHSLGAVLALELAHWFHDNRPGQLRHVFVAARPWPGEPKHEQAIDDALDDDAFLARLESLYGAPPESLLHPEIRAIALPALRADLRLLDSYAYVPRPPVDVPFTVYAGVDDPITLDRDLQAWQAETTAPLTVASLPHGHFFVEAARDHITGDICRALELRPTVA